MRRTTSKNEAGSAQAAVDSAWRAEIVAIVQGGLKHSSNVYELERFEWILEIASWDSETAIGMRRVQAALEGAAKSGLGFAQDDEDRQRYEAVLVIARRMGGGVELMGPAYPKPLPNTNFTADQITARYVTPKVAVSTIVDDGTGRMLLIQRADSGLWDMPAGMVDIGYSPAEIAVKETKEETGYDVDVVGLIGVWDPMRHGTHPLGHSIAYNVMFHAKVVGGELLAHPHECLDARWFTPETLPPPNQLVRQGSPYVVTGFAALNGTLAAPYFDPVRVAEIDLAGVFQHHQQPRR